MSGKPHVIRFAEAQSGDAGDPHRFDDDRRRVLWVLAEAKEIDELKFLTATQVSDILCECTGIDIPRQRAQAILEGESGTVARRRIAKRRHFRIMKAGEDELTSSSFTSTFVGPEKALSEIRQIEDLLSSLKGELKICDPYVENKTLDYLAECSSAKSLKLLTVNIYKASTFRRDLGAFQKEHGNRLDVRVAPQARLHDRYIVHDEGLLLLGTSLNGFAKKQTFLVSLGPDLRSATESAFDGHWAAAANFK